jgi:DNA-binding NarL/FixJ family response regulator
MNTILVADADPQLRRRVARALAIDGHQITEVDSQSGLLESLATSLLSDRPPFQVLVCSVTLPGWSGLNLLHALDESQVAPRVVLLRDWNGDDLLAVAYRHGAAAVLPREVNDDDLRSTIRNVLARH